MQGRTIALRARQRGAVFVEAVAVIPVFILMWTLMIFIRDVYLNKLQAINDARVAAWTTSASNCSQIADGVETHGLAVSQTGVSSDFATSMFDAAGASVDFSETFVSVTGTGNVARDATLLGRSYTPGASITLPCNIEPLLGNKGQQLGRYAISGVMPLLSDMMTAAAGDIVVGQARAQAAYLAAAGGTLAAQEAAAIAEAEAMPMTNFSESSDGVPDMENLATVPGAGDMESGASSMVSEDTQ